MIPTGFPEENAVLDNPSDMKAEDCDPLSVCRTTSGDGLPVVISCWKMSADELAEINRTGRVWLVVLGVTMPPAYLIGTRPFEEAK